MPYLIYRQHINFIDKHDLSDELSIGRLKTNDIVLNNESVSRRHCIIRRQDDGTYILSDKSSNGTYVEGHKLTQPHPLTHNSVFQILNWYFTFLDAFDSELSETYEDIRELILKEVESADRTVEVDTNVLRDFIFSEDRTAQFLKAINALTPEQDEDTLKKTMLDALAEIANTERALLLILRANGTLLVDTKLGFGDEEKLKDLKISRSSIDKVLRNNQTVMISKKTGGEKPPSIINFKLETVICIPLKGRGEIFGCVYLDSPCGPSQFAKGDMHLIRMLVQLLSIAIENIRLYRQVRDENMIWTEKLNSQYKIITQNKKMKLLHSNIRKYARFSAAILILGETGAGKELAARLIHESYRPHSRKIFVPVNCSAFPETLAESELFGYVKGAFSGADADKCGLFEAANGGTLFLDEIADLKPELQVKLLRVLQEREIRPVGATETRPVNVKIVAATNINLQDKEVRRQIGFRDDLYSRLEGVIFEIPPLRERTEDIKPLADFFLAQFSQTNKRPKQAFHADVLKIFKMYHWPGNVRELQNAVINAAISADGRNITVKNLPEKLLKTDVRALQKSYSSLEDIEKQHIISTLKLTRGRRIPAAKLLGISRDTLRRKIIKYRIADPK
jgi:transcriptional regulator with GAF, ATPase, and Fis domain